MKPRSVSCTPASLSPTFSTFGARPAATRTTSDFDVLLLAAGLDGHRDGILRRFDVRDLGAGENGDPALLERALDFLRGVGVLEGQDVRHDVDQRYLGAERVEDISELASHRAGADDDDRLGRLLENERLVGRDDRRLVQFQAGLGSPRTREPVDTTMALFASCFSSLPSGVFRTRFLPASVAVPLMIRDLVLLEEKLDALGVLQADGARALHGDAVVGLHFADGDAEVGGVTDPVGDRGRLEERFCGNTSPDDARAAEGLRAR